MNRAGAALKDQASVGDRPAPPRVGIVVPTLGQRREYLESTLASLAQQDCRPAVIVVGPEELVEVAERHDAAFLRDPGGLSRSINVGVVSLPEQIEYVGWLGDDDLLTKGSLTSTARVLNSHPRAAACFGVCEYIDDAGRVIWASKARRLALRTASIGPNLIPQPGALFRRSAWEAVGGLDEELRYTMDLDLFLKLRKIGPVLSTPATVAQFRWHDDSTTVSGRRASLAEAYEVRKRHVRRSGRWLVAAAYRPTVWATLWSARGVQSKTA